MHPIGIALAFLVFWSFVAAGSFLVAVCGRHLPALLSPRLLVPASIHLVGTLIGLAMVFSGLYAAAIVLFR